MNNLRIVTRLAIAGGVVAAIGMLLIVHETFQLAADYSAGTYTAGVWVMFAGCAAAIALQARRETLMGRDQGDMRVKVTR